MKKNAVLSILLNLIFSTALVLTLVVTYFNKLPKAGGFIRDLKNQSITLKDSIDIGNFFYIAGLTSKEIYFGNRQRTNYIFKASYSLKDTNHFKLDIPAYWERTEVRVDSPYVYAMDGTVPGIVYSKLPSMILKKVTPDLSFFSKSILLSANSIISKIYDGKRRQEILTSIRGNMTAKDHPGILEKQNDDGLFSLKGELEFEPISKRAVYIYSYRNQFIILDSSLNILRKANTIDTISRPKIEVIKLRTKNDSMDTYVPARPPLIVNRRCAITPDFVFIQSALKGDNEDKQIFNQNSIIDVYSMQSGGYMFSFYLPNFHTQKLSDFKVYGDTLVAIFVDYMCTYKLNFID